MGAHAVVFTSAELLALVRFYHENDTSNFGGPALQEACIACQDVGIRAGLLTPGGSLDGEQGELLNVGMR